MVRPKNQLVCKGKGKFPRYADALASLVTAKVAPGYVIVEPRDEDLVPVMPCDTVGDECFRDKYQQKLMTLNSYTS
jgi:hypothetical protein